MAITEIVKHRIDGEDDVCDGSVPLNVAVSNGIQAGVEGHLAAVVLDAEAINNLLPYMRELGGGTLCDR